MRRLDPKLLVAVFAVVVGLGAAAGTDAQAARPRVVPVSPLQGEGYAALSPARLLDTRPGGSTSDGLGAGAGAVGAGQTIQVKVLGRGGVPLVGVGSVALHVTAVGQIEATFLTVYPTGIARPGTSNLNPVPGAVASNLVVVQVGAGGEVSLFNSAGDVHLIVDVEGWFPSSPRFTGVTPARLADTRPTGTRIAAGKSLSVQVGGVAGIPTSGVAAVVLNVTALSASASTFLTVHPSGTPLPGTSNLNVQFGGIAANLVVTPMGADGTVSIRNDAGLVHMIVDVQGWFATGPGYNPVTPARVVDTRSAAPLGPNSTTVIQLSGLAGIPSAGVGSVILNLTAVGATERTFFTVHADGSPRPLASDLNPQPGVVVPNLVIAKLGPNGAVDVYNAAGTVHVLVDVMGWLPSNVTAGDDAATITEDDALTPIPVLSNDVDHDGVPLRVKSAVQPANGTVVITGAGTGVSYVPNANYCNTPAGPADTFTYTLFGGVSATVAMTVTCVDDPPVAVADSATVTEDAAAAPVPVLANDTDVDGGTKSIGSVTQPVNGVVAIIGGGTGLTYAPNPNYCNNPPGSALDAFTYTLNGGSVATVTMTVTCVDAPPVAVADSGTVTEDAAATAVPVLANDTDIDGGPKTVASVTQPTNGTVAITGGGTGVTYAPNADYCNTPAGPDDTFTYTVNGGSVATVSMTVTCVNDVPGFVKGGDQSVLEDAGAQSVVGWATSISKGPANEAGQTVLFNVTGNTNAGLFAAGPAVSSTGTLSYTPAANANGAATITLDIQDNGGTTNGGIDTSATQTFTITVTAVNDAPVAQSKPTSGQIAVQANMKRVGIGAALLTGVTDADTGVNGCSPAFSVASITASSGGTVSNVNLVAGTFDFEPTPGFTGTAIVNYTVSDDGCPGVATSLQASISLTVGGPVIWFVDPAAGVNGTGTLASPFNVLSAADAVDAANHRVFVYSGTTATGLTLNSGEWLIGQAATGPFDTLFGITPPAGTISRPTMGTGTATIGGTVTLATNAKVQGVAISTGASNGLVGSGGITGINVSESKITTTTGTALNLNNAVGAFTLSSVSSNGAANGIVLNNTGAGTLTVTGTGIAGSGGTIQSTTGDGISLTNTKDVSLAWMNISSTGGSGVNGTGVTNFGFVNGVIIGAGNASFESAIAFNGSGTGLGNNIAGTLTVTDNTLTNPFYSGLDVQSDNGIVTNAVISGNTITNPGFSGVNLVGTGNAATSFSLQNATIDQNGISGSGGNGVQVSIGNSNATGPGATAGVPGDGTKLISITNNSVTLDSTGTNAILVANSGGNSGSRTKTNLLVQCNGKSSGGCTAPGALNGSAIGTVVGIGNNGFSDMTGIVNNNLIDANHTGGGGNGIGGGNGVAGAGNAWTPNLTLTVTNNTITNTDGNGILLVGRGTSGVANLKIQNNTVAAPLGGVRPGIRVDAGNAGSADDAVCLNISGNTSAGSGGSLGIGLRKQGTVATTNDFSVNGMAATATPGVESYVDGLNPSGSGTLLISATSGFSNCSLP